MVFPSAADGLQTRPPSSAAVSSPRRPITFRAYGVADTNILAASQSFDAVVGRSRLTAFGGGLELFREGTGVFYRGVATTMSAEGERVIAANDEVIPLGIALTVRMNVIEAGGGWRFSLGRAGRFVPYLGGALLGLEYIESSALDQAGDSSDRWFPGIVGFGGADVRIAGWWFAGGEAQFRSVPNAIGEAGVSRVFNENDLGGFTLRATIGIRK